MYLDLRLPFILIITLLIDTQNNLDKLKDYVVKKTTHTHEFALFRSTKSC
jgi:hypothetical protein